VSRRGFLPFSEGSRNCVGQALALVELKAVLAMLLGHFALRWVGKADLCFFCAGHTTPQVAMGMVVCLLPWACMCAVICRLPTIECFCLGTNPAEAGLFLCRDCCAAAAAAAVLLAGLLPRWVGLLALMLMHGKPSRCAPSTA
jgi:hypothetical protein